MRQLNGLFILGVKDGHWEPLSVNWGVIGQFRGLSGVGKGSEGFRCAPFQHCLPPLEVFYCLRFAPHDSPTGLSTLGRTQQLVFVCPFRHS